MTEEITTHHAVLPGGARYLAKVPRSWDGTLILYSQGPLVQESDPFWTDSPVTDALLARGHAVAGWASDRFWHLEEAFAHQVEVLDALPKLAGQPERVLAYGQSIGGLITAGLVQLSPERLDGALSTCGPLAGGVATMNRELDIAFVVKTLLGEDTPLQVTAIEDLDRNQELAKSILEQAAQSPSGRARLALAAAIANVPGWADPTEPSPGPSDVEARLDGQLAWFRQIVFGVVFAGRAVIEQRAAGNPSWNVGVDYRALLDDSDTAAVVHAMYDNAGLSLGEDLDRLAQAPRIDADPDAVRYMERHIVFDGRLNEVPILTLHSAGDGLCTPDHEQAYADVVQGAGSGSCLRQLYVERAGHCVFPVGEVMVAFDALTERVDGGSWGSLDADALNDAAARLTFDSTRAVDAYGPIDAGVAGPAFTSFTPRPFPRPYDSRAATMAAPR